MPDEKKDKGILETIREVNQKERAEKIKNDAQRQLKAAEKKEKEKDEYSRQLEQEKLELIKLKQGLIEESTLIKEENTVSEYTLKDRIGAFFYCNKGMIILALFFIILAIFLIYDLATKDRPDMTVMVLTNDQELDMHHKELADIFTEYIYDVNENGETHATVYYMPLSQDTDPYTRSASSTKLYAIMQSGDTLIVIGNDEAHDYLLPETTLENLEELFPDNEHVKGYGFYLSDTNLAEEIGYEGEIPEDVYIGIRKVSKGARYREEMQKNYDVAFPALEKFIERFS